VKVVGHKRPGEAFCTRLDKELRKAREESSPVGVVAKEVAAVDATDDYMLQKIWNIKVGGSWHAKK